MRRQKTALAIAAVALAISIACVGAIFYIVSHIFVDGRAYSKTAQTLDLRGEEITAEHYEKLRRKLPHCEILWDIPFQGEYYAQDTKTLSITNLTDGQVRQLDYLLELETVHAEGCMDYAALAALQERRPEVEVRYTVPLNGQDYAQDVKQLALSGIASEEVEYLNYLPQLEEVTLTGGSDGSAVWALLELCREKEIQFQVEICGKKFDQSTTRLEVEGAGDKDLPLIQALPGLTAVHIVNPTAQPETLVGLLENYPALDISWEMDVLGVRVSSADTEVNLSGAVVPSIAELENAMAYFPNAQKLILYGCVDPALEGTISQKVEGKRPGGVTVMQKATVMDYEALAQYRDRVRDQYKVVWTVPCGDKLTACTDDISFMPTREHVYYFLDSEAVNLRYCEDMVCIDIGHMGITDVSFVESMPNLKYLILAHTQVRDISPLESCKNLVFLELDWSTVKDFTPLLGCTGLEDLNIGNTYADIDPITQMTWLKNLWMVGRSSAAYKVIQALPDTRILYAGDATVAGGWRDLQNYFDMRDTLSMGYMPW